MRAERVDIKPVMLERIGEPAMLEQLAEECTELAKAALKKARILRDENPARMTLDEAEDSILEEYTDVVQCADELGLAIDKSQIKSKQLRFLKLYETRHPATPTEGES